MWHDLFFVQISVVEKIVRTIAVYALIVLIFRVIGKRSISTLNTMDFVVMFLLSNVVQNAIIGEDNSFLGGAIGAVTLVATNSVLTRVALISPRFRRLVEGSAVDVITDGVADQGALRRLGLRTEELDHAIRLQNGDDISEIGRGTVEPGGQFVLTLKPAEQDATRSDIEGLTSRLERIEALLLAQARGSGSPGLPL